MVDLLSLWSYVKAVIVANRSIPVLKRHVEGDITYCTIVMK